MPTLLSDRHALPDVVGPNGVLLRQSRPFSPPPVYIGYWDEAAWDRYILSFPVVVEPATIECVGFVWEVVERREDGQLLYQNTGRRSDA